MLIKTVSIKNAPLVLRIARTVQWMLFLLPTLILFYQFKGLTIGDFFLIQGISSLMVFALEIPTGYIGDLFCRKKVILMSLLSFVVGHLIWLFFKGFFFILLGELFFALCMSLFSGTAEAYLHDVLEKDNRKHDLLKEIGKLDTWATLGTTIATLSGAVMYQYMGPDAVILIETIIVGLAFVIAFALPNIPDMQRQVEDGKSKLQDIWDIVKYSAKHPEIKWLMLYPAAFGAGTFILMWGMQPLMEMKSIAIALFGIFMGANQLFRTLFAHFSHSIFEKMNTNKLSILLFYILIIGFSAAFIGPDIDNTIVIYVILILMALTAASQICLRIVTSAMIHHRIKSDERATILSVNAMFRRVGMAFATISVKFLIDGYDLQTTYIVMGVILISATAYSLVRLLKLKII